MKAEAPTSLKFLVKRAGLATALAASLAGLAFATSPSLASGPSAKWHMQELAITIMSPQGRGAEHLSQPSNFAIAPGVPVQVTVTNFTREFHTFTIPELHVSRLIPPARGQTPRKTTFTFTTYEGDQFAWFCAICQSDGHGHSHPMGGTIRAIINPSVLPGG